jgi:hypothetical protein
MWTAPGKMLHQVYGNAFSYAFQGARLVALEDVPAPAASVDLKLGSFVRLVSAMLWRTTPLTWIGLLLGIILLLAPSRDEVQRSARLAGTLAGVAALAFVVLFAVAQGRNSPHYILASYVMVNLLAGIGWYLLFRWLSRRTGKAWIPVACMAAILALQAGSALAQYPYYFTYQNPILARLQPPEGPAFAYGEGLELAAEYLASLPGAKDSVALAYYGRGCFSYLFPGQTERFKPYYVEAGHESELRQALDGADYLVVYPAVQGSLQKYAALFQALSQAEPLKEFWLDGYRYAAIYRVDAFPPGVYAALFPNDAP